MAKAPKSLILNGPNLNMLGTRQSDFYGRETLSDTDVRCRCRGLARRMPSDCRQSNAKGPLVDLIQAAPTSHDGIYIDPGAYSHTWIAIMDALMGAAPPRIAGHLSNTHRRETSRQRSSVSKVADAVPCGLGRPGYPLALDATAQPLNAQQET